MQQIIAAANDKLMKTKETEKGITSLSGERHDLESKLYSVFHSKDITQEPADKILEKLDSKGKEIDSLKEAIAKGEMTEQVYNGLASAFHSTVNDVNQWKRTTYSEH